MNNAEFRSQIAREMIALHKEKNSRLDTINNLGWIDEFVKELARGQIIENFYNGIDELKKSPWYEEAKLTLETKRKAFLNRKRLLSEKDKKEWIVTEIERINQELDDADLCLSMANFCHLWRWNKEVILRDIRNNHIRINKCTKKQMWDYWSEDPTKWRGPSDPSFHRFKYRIFKWAEFCVDLPKIWSFEWFKSKLFVPCFSDRWYETDEDRKLRHSLTVNIADALRNYLLEFWVEIDKGVNYKREEPYYVNSDTEWMEFLLNIIRPHVN